MVHASDLHLSKKLLKQMRLTNIEYLRYMYLYFS